MSAHSADSNFADQPLRLAGVSYKGAKFACENWHYAKRMPQSKLCYIGVWEHGRYIGAIVFGRGSSGVGSLYKTLRLEKTQVCELQRVALRNHESSVTKIISIALRLLKTDNPGLSLVISYADPKQGHKGTIYQAGNWQPFGMSAADKAFKFFDGSILHSRGIGNKQGYKNLFGKMCRRPRACDAIETIDLPPKYRFLYALDDAGKQAIERAKQAMAGSHSAQRRGGTDPHAPKENGAGRKARPVVRSTSD